MKVVLDTNVIIDGVKDDYSYEKQIIDAIVTGKIEAFANHQTLRENKLITRQLINSSAYAKEMNELFSRIQMVENKHQIHIVEDSEDNKILESAVEAEADYLITRDNALLKIAKYEGVSIVTPAEFWNRYQEDSNDLWQQWTNFFSGK